MFNRTYHPRNNMVLLRRTRRKVIQGLALPDESLASFVYTVVAKGPKVEDLEIGDKVWVSGAKDVTYGDVPGEVELIFTSEQYVVTKYEENK